MYGYGNSMFLATHGILARTASGGGVDPDAQAFITAASITDPTQQSAINQLVLDLKGYSIWTKFKAIYPIVGGTAASHKWNLNDPRDLDAAFRLTFSTGWTHSANGMLPTNAWANTFLNGAVSLSQNSEHLSYYSRTNSNGTEVEIGHLLSGVYSLLEIRTAGTSYFTINAGAFATYSDANSQGLYVANRTASNVLNGWKNGTKVVTTSTASSGTINNNIYIGTYNQSGAPDTGTYTKKECAFASIGDGLTDTDAANFYTAVQAYQTTLNRQI